MYQTRSYGEVKQELQQLISLIGKGKNTFEDAKQQYEEEKRKKEAPIEELRRSTIEELEQMRKDIVKFGQGISEKGKQEIMQLATDKSQGFPWLAEAYSDYFHLKDLQIADILENKSHPAIKAAEQVREIASQRRVAEKLYRVLKYKLEYYENLFPWLIEFTSEDVDDLILQIMEKSERGKIEPQEPDDAAKKWLTPAEYQALPSVEKYQLALDRYWKKPKSKWEIGRDYERYIGYLYENRGYSVYYQGIVEGLADLGRDLVCKKDNLVDIVQCKYWSKKKQIHEKHTFQLLGTVIAYRIDNPRLQITPWLITSTMLSDRAKGFAKELEIRWAENYPIKPYPSIKCNVSRKDGTKIYHLPFDQQYDKTLVEEERNELYAETVKEAEALGFRRAFRWRGADKKEQE